MAAAHEPPEGLQRVVGLVNRLSQICTQLGDTAGSPGSLLADKLSSIVVVGGQVRPWERRGACVLQRARAIESRRSSNHHLLSLSHSCAHAPPSLSRLRARALPNLARARAIHARPSARAGSAWRSALGRACGLERACARERGGAGERGREPTTARRRRRRRARSFFPCPPLDPHPHLLSSPTHTTTTNHLKNEQKTVLGQVVRARVAPGARRAAARHGHRHAPPAGAVAGQHARPQGAGVGRVHALPGKKVDRLWCVYLPVGVEGEQSARRSLGLGHGHPRARRRPRKRAASRLRPALPPLLARLRSTPLVLSPNPK